MSLLRCFWEVVEMSLSMEICLRHLKDISFRLGIYSCFYDSRKSVNWKKTKNGENIFLKLLLIDFGRLTSKLISRVKEQQIVYGRSSIKSTSWKGNDVLLKVDSMHSLFRSPWQWLLAENERRGVWTKILMVFTSHFPFVYCVGKMCK